MATKENESIDKWQWRSSDPHGDGDCVDDGWNCTDSEDKSCSEIDSDEDPTYDPSGESGSRLSTLSIGNASMGDKKPAKVALSVYMLDITEKKACGAEGQDIVDAVRALAEAEQIEKLKVEECKDYLRRNGLRLTGNKETLLQRIREHYEMRAGEGERKYPTHSFVINCKGDACIGDVVMFEQNVYDQYSIVSRSATAPCGKRVVVGRIVKESYGARKQQHTFTIEVLWSKGYKPFPPLHPVLIKGRNLYRFRTLRQRWEDEELRQRCLQEKHSRGDVARSDREARIQEKERGNRMRTNRMPKISQTTTAAGKKGKDPHLAVSGSNLGEASAPNLQECYDKIGIQHHPFQGIHRAKPYQPGFRNPAPDQHHSSTNTSSHCFTDRRPPANMKRFPRDQFQEPNQGRRQVCRYFEQGRCYFGDNCKFLHQYRQEQEKHQS
ncbi:hypothetical protein MLD38_030777 [Melastoma candidum]|uniref:Uncharacterized protein n=1 Tax=Melastoma candidum TaxID=119954 RepID=A0ACB9MMK5_9MYRT|nr:hypothetical protein MLD38_030777 [Melastoma candidum]